jgi:hypothetical protein
LQGREVLLIEGRKSRLVSLHGSKEGGLKGEGGEEFSIKASNKQTNMNSGHFYL